LTQKRRGGRKEQKSLDKKEAAQEEGAKLFPVKNGAETSRKKKGRKKGNREVTQQFREKNMRNRKAFRRTSPGTASEKKKGQKGFWKKAPVAGGRPRKEGGGKNRHICGKKKAHFSRKRKKGGSPKATRSRYLQEKQKRGDRPETVHLRDANDDDQGSPIEKGTPSVEKTEKKRKKIHPSSLTAKNTLTTRGKAITLLKEKEKRMEGWPTILITEEKEKGEESQACG